MAATSSYADTFLSDNFDSYPNGALVGQGGWLQTSTINTNPIQVSGGAVVMGTAGGQDVYDPFATTISMTLADQVVTSTMDITVASAKSGGDYFFHLSNPAGTTTNFYNRLFIKTSGSGYVLGIAGGVTGATTATYGTTVLSFASLTTVSTVWTSVAGGNDTIDIYVNGSSYLTGYSFADAGGITTLAAANFRQGGTTTSPGLTIDNLSITAVPEPHEYGMAIAGMLVALVVVRRRKAALFS